jgi:2,4-dienoyl-CoA reductase-like NADH-dependent reductase (Old Yellow Enzyme family)/thioredoxin reductase
MRTDPLLTPFVINSLTLRNRIYSSAHAPHGYLVNGIPGKKYALYHEEKARGGIGLTMIGGSSNVSIDSANVFDQFPAWSDEVLPFYHDVSSRVHQYGTAVMVQLTHLGRRSQADVDNWLPSIAPSAVRERAHRSFPKAMENFDFDRIVRDFGRAAYRAREGGLDGVELCALGGHLLDQFWSERTNRRTDRFNATSIRDAVAFSLHVLEEVRSQVGHDYPVGVRMSCDEGAPGGIGEERALEVARLLVSSGTLDFLSIAQGAGFTDRELADVIPPFGRPQGATLEIAGRFRAALGVPILHAGRIADTATARHAIRDGLVDIVGMTRAHIADPHIVQKISSGEEHRIRPCVGAMYCLSAAGTYCIHNPATGREGRLPHSVPKAPNKKRVVVVGGGPAGLEAARVCAERGHSVTLFEAAHKLGGQVILASRVPRHSEKAAIVGWLSSEVRHAGVDVRLSTYAEKPEIDALSPEVVIVASGGVPNVDIIPEGTSHLRSTWDVMDGSFKPTGSVLIFDDHGGESALTATELLIERGCRVEIVSPDHSIGLDVSPLLRPDYLGILYRAGVQMTLDHELSAVRHVGRQLCAALRNVYTDEIVERSVDHVVVEHGTLPVADVYHALREDSVNGGELDLHAFAEGQEQRVLTNPSGRYQLFRIGDALSHRGIHAALLDARRLCTSL